MPGILRAMEQPERAGPALVEEASRGDADALRRLLAHMLPEVKRIAERACGPRLRELESVSDVVSSVCREVLGDLSGLEYRGSEPFLAFVREVVRRKAADHAKAFLVGRRDVRRNSPLGDAGGLLADQRARTPSEVAMSGEYRQQIAAALDRLEPADRDVLVLRRQGLAHAEIAARLEISVEAVRKRYTRALQRFSTLLPDP